MLIGERLVHVLRGWTTKQEMDPIDLRAHIPSAGILRSSDTNQLIDAASSSAVSVRDYADIANDFMARSRKRTTHGKHERVLSRWAIWATTVGIPTTLQTQASDPDERALIVHIIKTYFAHLSLTLCDDKKRVGRAKSKTIASHISLVVFLHKSAQFHMEHDEYISDVLKRLQDGRDSQLLDMGIPLHKPPRFASNITLMTTMTSLPWNHAENVTQKTYNSAIALITIAMLRPHDILETNHLFNPLRDTTWGHLKWFRTDDNKEIPLTVTNMILILRLRHVFVVIKRPLTKNSRSVPNPAPIVARIEPKSSSWSPVSSIAEHCLEFLMCHRGRSAALSTTPLYTTADSISWLPYRMVHRIYKSKISAALIIRDGKKPSKKSLERWTTYSQKIYYKAALDAHDIHPEIIRQLGAWAPAAGDTPYSRLNEKHIHKTRAAITDSDDTFLELSW